MSFFQCLFHPGFASHACFSLLRWCSLVPSLFLLLAAVTTFGSGQEEKLIFGLTSLYFGDSPFAKNGVFKIVTARKWLYGSNGVWITRLTLLYVSKKGKS